MKVEFLSLSTQKENLGICCIFICFNHCQFFNKFSFGEVGVEFFIILSGFLTASNAARHPSLRRLYFLSKIRKIIPLYWVTTLLVFSLGVVFPQLFSSLEFNLPTLLNSLFLIPGSTYILFPGWTLTYFFVFYLIYRLSDLLGKQRDFIASAIVVSLVICGFIVDCQFKGNIFSKYANPIMLEFVYGIGLYHLSNKIANKCNCELLGLK